jgi:predicted transcriptional regulator
LEQLLSDSLEELNFKRYELGSILFLRTRRFVMQVSEIMHKGVSTVQLNDSIKKVAALMKREDIGAVPVYKNEKAVGFVTDRDIVLNGVARGLSVDDSISHVITRQVISVHETDDVDHATHVMKHKQVSRLLVVDAGEQPVGMLTLADITLNSEKSENMGNIMSEIKRG